MLCLASVGECSACKKREPRHVPRRSLFLEAVKLLELLRKYVGYGKR